MSADGHRFSLPDTPSKLDSSRQKFVGQPYEEFQAHPLEIKVRSETFSPSLWRFPSVIAFIAELLSVRNELVEFFPASLRRFPFPQLSLLLHGCCLFETSFSKCFPLLLGVFLFVAVALLLQGLLRQRHHPPFTITTRPFTTVHTSPVVADVSARAWLSGTARRLRRWNWLRY
jgi:hypothetical protein